ncbi:MAG: hypothetical protein ACHREM_01465 [Polyangiales bacterium]
MKRALHVVDEHDKLVDEAWAAHVLDVSRHRVRKLRSAGLLHSIRTRSGHVRYDAREVADLSIRRMIDMFHWFEVRPILAMLERGDDVRTIAKATREMPDVIEIIREDYEKIRRDNRSGRR